MISYATGREAYELGLKFGTRIQAFPKHVCIAHDGVKPDLLSCLAVGLTETGCHVQNWGALIKPVFFHTIKPDVPSVYIEALQTANSFDTYGFIDGEPLSRSAFAEMLKIAPYKTDDLYGTHRLVDVYPSYIKHLASLFPDLKGLRVVWGSPTGAFRERASDIFEALNMRTLKAPCLPTIDQHHLQIVIQAVLQHKADLGFIFNHTGTELTVIDNLGRVVLSEHIAMLLLEALKLNHVHIGPDANSSVLSAYCTAHDIAMTDGVNRDLTCDPHMTFPGQLCGNGLQVALTLGQHILNTQIPLTKLLKPLPQPLREPTPKQNIALC